MSESKGLELKIHLSRWIIEDGNYSDFSVGETRKFAVEFGAGLPLTRSNDCVMSLREMGYDAYSISGELVFAANSVRVIDCGLPMYSERKDEIEGECKVGDFLQGNLGLGVDPFFYFEQHYKIPGIPALIYEWRINSIEQDTTPYILSNDGRFYTRDETQRQYKPVRGTAKDLIVADLGPEFILYCSRLVTKPSHTLSRAERGW
jgi:hypothetical protein